MSVTAAVLAVRGRGASADLAGRPIGRPSGTRRDRDHGSFDFVIIGAGPAGEAAAYKARELGASRRGRRSRPGSAGAARTSAASRRSRCSTAPPGTPRTRPTLPLDARLRTAATTWSTGRPSRRARRRRATSAASRRPGPSCYPRRRPRSTAPGRRRRHATTAVGHELGRARNVIVAVGSFSKVPAGRGPRPTIPTWTNREATLGPRAAAEPARPRRRPDRLRAGPGLRPVRRPDHDRPVRAAPRPDRPSAQLRGDPARRSSATASRSGLGVRAIRARAGAGADGAHVIELDDGTTAEGHVILLAVGRAFPLDDLGLEHYGHRHDRPDAVPARRPAARSPTACG